MPQPTFDVSDHVIALVENLVFDLENPLPQSALRFFKVLNLSLDAVLFPWIDRAAHLSFQVAHLRLYVRELFLSRRDLVFRPLFQLPAFLREPFGLLAFQSGSDVRLSLLRELIDRAWDNNWVLRHKLAGQLEKALCSLLLKSDASIRYSAEDEVVLFIQSGDRHLAHR